jgi:hypothetical protein
MHIFHTLNRTLFKISNKQAQSKLPFDEVPGIIELVLKMCDDIRPTTMIPNVLNAFDAIWFEFNTQSELYRVLFQEERFRESKVFQELWCVNLPLADP